VPERFLGRTLGGRYRLTRCIGAGAYAWVYEGRDLELEIPVAVKVLRPEHAGQPVIETRFRREATTAARLRHPNIVTIRDIGTGDDVTWVVMDLVPGSLAHRLRVRSVLPESEVVRLGLDVAAALAAAHAIGVIHRDIKPDNILLGAAGEAVVCDFGLARALTDSADLSASNQVVGTPHYFSPEQAKGEPLDGRSDLYALGVTLFRAATGRLPFEGTDWYAVARQHVETPAPDARAVNAALSHAFAAILADLLAKTPEARPASAAELFDRLAQLPSAPSTGGRLALATGATTALHPVISAPAPASRRLRWSLLATGTVALLLWLSHGAPSAGTIWARASGVLPTDPVITLMDSLPPVRTIVDDARAATPAAGTLPIAAPTPVAPRPGRLTVHVPVGAELTVDGQAVNDRPYTEPRAGPGAYMIAARFVSGPGIAGCPSSSWMDTVTVRPGEAVTVTAPIARCTRLVLDVTPRDAVVTFEDSAGTIIERPRGGDRRSPLLLRAGTWRIRGHAPRCATYDAVDTLRAGDDTVRFVMLC
jgi:tRNA A-37 threonylcarbamoyl transferase component Bud32